MLNSPIPFSVSLLLVFIQFGIASEPSVRFIKSELLPEVRINGRKVAMHTQGLYVTEASYYVTGRLETRPKRAYFFRFRRSDLTQYESLDITPPADFEGTLDHPGGFDSDGTHFWIPIARSQPAAPSIVMKLKIESAKSLQDARRQVAFQVNDHIGAICVDKNSGLLYGANWDTNKIYAWDTSGKPKFTIAHSKLLKGDSSWHLAVQDWKMDDTILSPGTIIAGGIDKSAARNGSQSASVIDILDIKQRKRLGRIRLPNRDDVKTRLTNEGLAVFNRELFLLPEDLGRGAKILRFRLNLPSQ